MLYSQEVVGVSHLRRKKKFPIDVKDDIIEVMLRDNNLNMFYKQAANINNKKQMAFLLASLKAKGVHLGKIAKSIKIEWLE